MQNSGQIPAPPSAGCFVAGVFALVFWIAALLTPYRADVAEFGGGSGWFLLVVGWIGPFALSFAWYANIFFIIALFQLLNGRPPGFCMSSIGLVIAMTVLLPCYLAQTAICFSGPAVWFWLLALIVAWLPALFTRIHSK